MEAKVKEISDKYINEMKQTEKYVHKAIKKLKEY